MNLNVWKCNVLNEYPSIALQLYKEQTLSDLTKWKESSLSPASHTANEAPCDTSMYNPTG